MSCDDTRIVEHIIEEALDNRPLKERWICKAYVLEEIKNRFRPSELHNWAIAHEVDTDDGIENMKQGAIALFNVAMQRLPQFELTTDDRIIRRNFHVKYKKWNAQIDRYDGKWCLSSCTQKVVASGNLVQDLTDQMVFLGLIEAKLIELEKGDEQ